MNNCDLRDLTLAGVQWELTDVPFILSVPNPNNTPHPTPDDNASAYSGIRTRTQTSIVPPIAPTQSMSVATANAMAARPIDMDSLNRMIAEFNHPLRGGATNVILPHVAQNPNGMVIITDIPSGDDDACGKILTGAAGELLDKMLAAIKMSRDSVSVVPLIFWRTPGGRAPSRDELDLARPFVNRALELLHPRLILTLGTLAASEIGGISLPRGHGVINELPDGTQMMPIFHPNYLLLKPAAKRDAWNALQTVEKLLKTA